MTKDTMKLWNAVSKTNPNYTKTVKFGREFTAIDPHSQIMEATRAFGPAGQGWGWTVAQVEYLPTKDAAVLVRLWHGDKDNSVEQWGQAGLYMDKNNTKTDNDCMKKATTDGLTKCLSYLGFNADVFLGKFDDSKYVAERRAEQEEEDKQRALDHNWTPELQKKFDAISENLKAANDIAALKAVVHASRSDWGEIKTAVSHKSGELNTIFADCTETLEKQKEAA